MLNTLKRFLNRNTLFYNMNLFICNKKWRKMNKNNFTTMGNLFDKNSVEVGISTYGTLNINQFEKNNGKLKIGAYCSIAPKVDFLLDGEHYYKGFTTYPFKKKFFKEKETLSKGNIVIDDDVWIGFGATILSGVHIGQGAIIGAKALITKDVPPYAIVGGVPARVIRYRFSKEKIQLLLKNLNFSEIKVDKIEKSFLEMDIENMEDQEITEKINLMKGYKNE